MISILTLSFLLLAIHVDANRMALRSEVDISQNWLLGTNPKCNFKCKNNHRREYCGSNGRTYNSVCEKRRAKCLDRMLKTKRGRCKEAVCIQARDHALLKMKVDSKHSVYVPNCTADGNYAPRQCNVDFHTCWCVSPDGKLVEGSVVDNGEPSCNGGGNVRRSTETCTANKRATLRENVRGKIMREYRKATPRSEVPVGNELLRLALEWEFSNVDKDRNSSISLQELRIFLKKIHARECVSAFSHLCDVYPDNGISSSEWMTCLYSPLTPKTKKQDPARPATIPATDILSVHRNTVNGILNAKCPRDDRTSLITKMRDWMVSESQGSVTNPSTLSPGKLNDQEESVISSEFSRFDTDGNGKLSPREMKPLRRRFRRNKFKECFMTSCDKDRDRSLTADEFTKCLSSSRKSNCAKEKREAIQSQRAQESVYVPDCETEDSRYFSQVQCHAATSYCWCADRDTGRPIPGTSIRGDSPDCARSTSSSLSDLSIPGCNKPQAFMASLQKAIVRKMLQARRSGSVKRASVPTTFGEDAATWLHQTLDANDDNQVNRRESKAFRRLFRRKVTPKKCLKKFMRFCDRNRNKKVTRDEFLTCLQLTTE